MSWIKRSLNFCNEVIKYFFAVDASLKAAALAYTALISIVPLMVLSLGFLVAFPNLAVHFHSLQELLFRHFVPSSANTIQTYFELFAKNAVNLSATSLVFFLITAVLLIFTMESVFNGIWQIKTRRRGLPAFLMYWAILTMLTPAGGVIIAITIFLYSLPYVSNIMELVVIFIPFLLSLFGFLFLYMTIPNRKVYFRHALAGALIAAILFELMKAAFNWYLDSFSPNTMIYGVLAAIPGFLMWLYICWLIVILGAVISYKASLDTKKTISHHAKTT